MQKTAQKSRLNLCFIGFQLLNEEAMLSGNDFGLRVDEKKSRYHFMRLKSQGWQKLEQHHIPPETELADNLAIMLTLGGNVWNDQERFV